MKKKGLMLILAIIVIVLIAIFVVWNVRGIKDESDEDNSIASSEENAMLNSDVSSLNGTYVYIFSEDDEDYPGGRIELVLEDGKIVNKELYHDITLEGEYSIDEEEERIVAYYTIEYGTDLETGEYYYQDEGDDSIEYYTLNSDSNLVDESGNIYEKQ